MQNLDSNTDTTTTDNDDFDDFVDLSAQCLAFLELKDKFDETYINNGSLNEYYQNNTAYFPIKEFADAFAEQHDLELEDIYAFCVDQILQTIIQYFIQFRGDSDQHILNHIDAFIDKYPSFATDYASLLNFVDCDGLRNELYRKFLLDTMV